MQSLYKYICNMKENFTGISSVISFGLYEYEKK